MIVVMTMLIDHAGIMAAVRTSLALARKVMAMLIAQVCFSILIVLFLRIFFRHDKTLIIIVLLNCEPPKKNVAGICCEGDEVNNNGTCEEKCPPPGSIYGLCCSKEQPCRDGDKCVEECPHLKIPFGKGGIAAFICTDSCDISKVNDLGICKEACSEGLVDVAGLCCNLGEVNDGGSCQKNCGTLQNTAGLCCKSSQVNFKRTCRNKCPSNTKEIEGICCNSDQLFEGGLCNNNCYIKMIMNEPEVVCCKHNEVLDGQESSQYSCIEKSSCRGPNNIISGLCCRDPFFINDNGKCRQDTCEDGIQIPKGGLCCDYKEVNDGGICKDNCSKGLK